MKKILSRRGMTFAVIVTAFCGLLLTDLPRVADCSLNESGLTSTLLTLMIPGLWVLLALCALYLGAWIVYSAVNRKNTPRGENTDRRILPELCLYFVTAAIVSGILALIYRNANLSLPLVYGGGDEMGVYYLISGIREDGITLTNSRAGGMSGADMFDYVYSDKLSFVLVRCISLFVSNPYTIATLFYFLCYLLNGWGALYACRRLGMKPVTSVAVGILFAFSPFIQLRFSHLWLCPYFMLAPACAVAVEIIEGKPREENGSLRNNRTFCGMLFIAFLCAFTGMYYAYFACALFAAAWLIRLIRVRGKEFRKELYPLVLIAVCVIGVGVNVLPNLMYWKINGASPYSEYTLRAGAEAETYGLKLTQMLLPRLSHRLSLFRSVIDRYTATYPLINENTTASLGLISAVGFLLGILSLFRKDSKVRPMALLSVCMFLIATVGGIGAIISVFVNIPMRCYNRMSLVIMILSLMIAGRLLENLCERCPKWAYLLICAAFAAIGVFDQTADYPASDYSVYYADRDMIDRIEENTEAGDAVFVLPYVNWPSQSGTYQSLIGVIESEDILWSSGAMQGRTTAVWQQAVAGENPESMLEELSCAGYDGILLDRTLYTQVRGEDAEVYMEEILTAKIGKQPDISDNGRLMYWDLTGYTGEE